MKTAVKIMVIDCGFVLRQVRDKQGLRVNGVAPPDEPLESFKPSRSLKELGYVKNLFIVFSSHMGVHCHYGMLPTVIHV